MAVETHDRPQFTADIGPSRAGTIFPALPEIGHPEMHYAKLAKHAEHQGDHHLHEAAKVGQYVTLALDHSLTWQQKLRYFRHAMDRHCIPPKFADDACWAFYKDLADLIREYAGREALRLASAEDDAYAARIEMGQLREKVEADAEEFFMMLMGRAMDCPVWFLHEDWDQLKLIRDQWI